MTKKAPYQYASCKVDRVLDGDTVDVWINLGFSTFVMKRVRLYGINAPESRTRDLEVKALGLAAKQRMIELLAMNQTGEEWFIDLESHELGKYGRVLGVIWNGDININERLVSEGHADVYWGGKR